MEKNEGQLVRVVRVFVSSPGDVAHERRRVDRVTERLNGEFAGIVRIETIAQSSLHSGQAELPAETPAAADCDVVIAIFWSQLGAELPGNIPRKPDYEPYPSVTAYDVLTAMAARQDAELPAQLVCQVTRIVGRVLRAADGVEVQREDRQRAHGLHVLRD